MPVAHVVTIVCTAITAFFGGLWALLTAKENHRHEYAMASMQREPAFA
jgi:hypothetical protein